MLRLLNLQGNLLTTLPEELWSIISIVTLSLAGNKLSSLSPSISKLAEKSVGE